VLVSVVAATISFRPVLKLDPAVVFRETMVSVSAQMFKRPQTWIA
jgi:hypothetical protein